MSNNDLISAKTLLVTQKRNVLTGRIALSGSVFSLIHFVLDFAQGLYQSSLFDASIFVVAFASYLLNRYGYHTAAKLTALGFVDILLLCYASLVPKEVGVYLFYFPFIVTASILFGKNESIYRYALILLAFLCPVILFATDFKPLGEYTLEGSADADLKTFFIINLVSSSIILVLCVHFIVRLNETSEAELQKLAEEVQAKNLRLEKTNRELDRFLYSTSHDLRSPLSSIKGLINVTRYDTQDEKIHQYLDLMVDRLQRLDNFIKDIIDYSKNARVDLRNELTDINIVINTVYNDLKYLEGAHKILIKKNIEVNHPVKLDKGRLEVIISNLLSNAIKYHDPAKEEQWIEIKVWMESGQLKMIVADNGSGISAEHKEHVFDMFYRGTVLSGGSGLGLFIVKETIDKMNGHITMESQFLIGTTFRITLPLY